MMDNCLASNSDTGGVGCDNMTMIVIGLLQGRTKEEWYKEVAARVANGDGPCAPPEYGKSRTRSLSFPPLNEQYTNMFVIQRNFGVREYITELTTAQMTSIWISTIVSGRIAD